MAHTNETPHFNLPQFLGTDKASWIGDINPAMLAIDTALFKVETDSSDAASNASAAQQSAQAAETAAELAQSEAETATEGVATLKTRVDSLTTEVGTLSAGQTSQGASITNLQTDVTQLQTDVQVAQQTATAAQQANTLLANQAGPTLNMFGRTVPKNNLYLVRPISVAVNVSPLFFTLIYDYFTSIQGANPSGWTVGGNINTLLYITQNIPTGTQLTSTLTVDPLNHQFVQTAMTSFKLSLYKADRTYSLSSVQLTDISMTLPTVNAYAVAEFSGKYTLTQELPAGLYKGFLTATFAENGFVP